jgi:DNA-directed RNA polymerase specialized sigma24 family protein
MIRSPWQRTAGWSPEEAAAELQARRAQLLGKLRGHNEARGIPAGAQEEIVDDAIAAVVMSRHGVSNQEHLFGAFWIAVAHRCARYREGRPFTRLGSRQRVEFESAVEHVHGPGDPFDTVELTDRMARAADLMAELDPRERQILTVMASYGIGPVPTARHLGLPLGEVRAADRSIKLKLNRVAAIAAAGRMCEFRYEAIVADAAGGASERDATRARAHVNACVPCGRVHRKLRREMRGREFQRAAAAAFLPLPAAPLAHLSGLGRLAAWFQQHTPRVLPHGGGERAAEVLGGAGVVKVAAVSTAVVIAGGTLTSHIVHSVVDPHPPAHHHAGHLVSQASQSYQPLALARAWADPNAAAIPATSRAAGHSTARSSRRTIARDNVPAPPSKSLGYLALGGSSSGSSTSTSAGTSSPARSASSTRAHTMVASVDEPAPSSASTSAPSSEPPSSSVEASPPPSSPARTGGGSNLNYLGQ